MKNKFSIGLFCLVNLYLLTGCNETLVNEVEYDSTTTSVATLKSEVTLPYLKGVDLSYVNELEDNGVTYTENDQSVDPYVSMSNHGANVVRLRLWHNPTWTDYSTLSDVKKSIQRAKDQNMYILLDFHYSDLWTDPERNQIPAAWLSVVDSLDILADSVSNYTTNVLTELYQEGLLPELVQIGNETNYNIMIASDDTTGLKPVNWTRNVTLLNAGINAVETFNTTHNKDIKTILHVAFNASDTKTWISNITSYGIEDFDMLGLSYYPQWQQWSVSELGQLAKYIYDTYDVQLLIAETGHIWTRDWDDDFINLMDNMAYGYPETPCPQLQKDFLIEVKRTIKENNGAGVIDWEPAWVSANNETLWGTGSNWENVTFYDFDDNLIEPGGVEFLSDNNVVVTFKVDMSGVDVSNGVYITGEFTADYDGNWQFFPMEEESDSIYSFSTFLNQGQSGAYYYLNAEDWSSAESVPSQCQEKWSCRLYSISSAVDSVTYKNKWGSCSTF